MKKYVFLFLDETTPKPKFLSEQSVEASGMYDAFTKVQKIANEYIHEAPHSLKIELKEVQYDDDIQYIDAIS